MDTQQLNQHIKNYLEKDKTRSAIMLTAPWGAGKSYYIQKTLIPYIKDKTDNKCVCVSLYGIKRLEDISKAIYLELRTQKFNAKKESVTSAKIIGKTILKGVSGYFGIDWNASEEDLQKLYEAIDLSGKLIILEDLERCSIDIIEVLGFVNNLVEQDGAKVLLVANEKEFITTEAAPLGDTTDPETHNSASRSSKIECHYTKKTEEYLRKKEKTICDTIVYRPSETETLQSIIGEFFSEDIHDILTDKMMINEVSNVMRTVGSHNLRALMYACQKTHDMFSCCTPPLDSDFVKGMLCSVIAYSCRLKKGEDCHWENAEDSPAKLGTERFPLYKVFYDYINYQRLDVALLREAEQNYLRRKKVRNAETEFNKYLGVLQTFYRLTEKEVSDAVVHLKSLLSKNESDEYIQYAALANCLIAAKDCVENVEDIEECNRLMLCNLGSASNVSEIKESIIHYWGVDSYSQREADEWKKMKEQMLDKLRDRENAPFAFFENDDDLDRFADCLNKVDYIGNRAFASKIDINNLIKAIKNSTASSINRFRTEFNTKYAFSNIGEYLSGDKENLIYLKESLESECLHYGGFDRVQKKQIAWFIRNLEDIIQRLK